MKNAPKKYYSFLTRTGERAYLVGRPRFARDGSPEVRITKTEAERLFRRHRYGLPFNIMSFGYDKADNRGWWTGLDPDDLNEKQRLHHDWGPFAIWEVEHLFDTAEQKWGVVTEERSC